MSDGSATIAERLNTLLPAAGLAPLDAVTADRFGEYVSLLLRWNARTNLTAIRDAEGILSTHIIESIIVAGNIPADARTLLDFGSGAGFPGIPIALCRPEISVTLAESQNKKAAFLREAVRVLGLSAKVHAGRAETLLEPYDCVAMRAVDRMADAVNAAARLVRSGGWLALMTTEGEQRSLKAAAGSGFHWQEPVKMPGTEHRILFLGRCVL